MNCRLCDQPKPLCNSHIIPEFCYRPLYDEKHKAVEVRNAPPKEGKLQKGFREALLCEDCERFFNDEYEKYFKHTWYDAGACPARPDQPVIRIDGLDYSRFKLFHLSVLWRASVTTREEFGAVSLGPHESVIRSMLRAKDPGPASRYNFVVQLLHLDGQIMHQAIMPPGTSREHGARVYTLVFAGCAWNYIVASHSPPHRVLDFGLRENGTLHLFVRSITDLGYFRRFVSELRAGSQPVTPRTQLQRGERQSSG